mgnify:FL=1
MKTIGLQIIPFRQIVEISSRPNTPRGCTEIFDAASGGGGDVRTQTRQIACSIFQTKARSPSWGVASSI